MEPIIFGLDIVNIVSIPLMAGLFVFAVWFGVTQCTTTDEPEELARQVAEQQRARMEALQEEARQASG